MRLLIFLVVIIVSSSCTFAGTGMVDDKYISDGKRAIGLCIERYKELSGNNFFSEVDRAYVLADPGKLDLLFASGEVGSFSKRSKQYRPYLACGVVVSGADMSIYYLSEPMRDVLIEISGVSQITEEEHTNAWDLLYMREGDEFSVRAQQRFDPEKIEVIKGTKILD